MKLFRLAILSMLLAAPLSHADDGTWQWVATEVSDCTPPTATCIVTNDPLQPFVQMTFEFTDRIAYPAHFRYSAVPYAQLQDTYAYYSGLTHTKIGKRYVGDSTWIVWITIVEA